jgi:isoquinoline 1-oxidoreductase
MDLTRRTFLQLAGGSVVYALTFSSTGCGIEEVILDDRGDVGRLYGVDYCDWLVLGSDGSVTVHTGRTEIGQGLTTVLSDMVSQALEVPRSRVEVIMGDTDTCPDDGPTTGSASTRTVGWGYWLVCERIRSDLIRRAAPVLDCRVGDLDYRDGEIVSRRQPERRIAAGKLADGKLRVATIDPSVRSRCRKSYVDRGNANVKAEAIVTGTLSYTGDLFPGECDYGSLLIPEYHAPLTRLVSAKLGAAKRTEGVHTMGRLRQSVFASGTSYRSVQEALAKVDATWQRPERPQELDNEREIRDGAELIEVIEERGNPERGFQKSTHVLAETYITQYASQAPIETLTAVASFEDGKVTVWAGTQNPFLVRERTAKILKLPEDRVRIISMPVGGAFGVKSRADAAIDAALLARKTGATVKVIQSLQAQFNRLGRYKESVLVDIKTGVTAAGKLVSRTIDIHQDRGMGTTGVYDIPNVLTRHYAAPMPVLHGVMRGTSYVQTGFAVESHIDMVAELVGLDGCELRRRNVEYPAIRALLDACAEMIGYGSALPEDHGIGFGLCHHGGRQLGAVAAEVSVQRESGQIRVERLAGAIDAGRIINIHTATMGVKGAMIWGLGYALFEEVKLDGHRSYTSDLDTYRIPRFSDVPPIQVVFLDNHVPDGSPRGCGELPVIPTIGAICNGVYQAIGRRFYTLPMTPERVRAALES